MESNTPITLPKEHTAGAHGWILYVILLVTTSNPDWWGDLCRWVIDNWVIILVVMSPMIILIGGITINTIKTNRYNKKCAYYIVTFELHDGSFVDKRCKFDPNTSIEDAFSNVKRVLEQPCKTYKDAISIADNM